MSSVYEVEAQQQDEEEERQQQQQQLPPQDAPGFFVCASCGSALFPASARGTASPSSQQQQVLSFSSAVDGALRLADVRVFGLERVAAACASCGLHAAFVSHAAGVTRYEVTPVSVRYAAKEAAAAEAEEPAAIVGILPAWQPKVELTLDPPPPPPPSASAAMPAEKTQSRRSRMLRLLATSGIVAATAAAPVLLSAAEAAGWLAKLA